MPNKPKTTKSKPAKRFINLPVWPKVSEEVRRTKADLEEAGQFPPSTSALLLKAIETYRAHEGLQAA